MTARNSVVDVILSRIDCGKLPPDKTEAMLHEIIDEEISRTDTPADTDLVDGCLGLLEQLHQPVEVLPERKKHRILLTAGKWVAAAAILVLLALGIMDKLHLTWFEHDNTPDGEQHIIVGHAIGVDVIEKAIAEHTAQRNYSFTSVQELEKELGFNPGVVPKLANNCTLERISVSFTPYAISITARYRAANSLQDYITLNVQCFPYMSTAGKTFKKHEDGTLQRINDIDVYLSHNAEAASWIQGSSVFTLSVNKDNADILNYVEQLLEGSIVPDDTSISITPEQIDACIQRNLTNPGQLQTSDFGEVCDYLGFTPALFKAKAVGADSVDFVVLVIPDSIRVNAFYCNADGTPLIAFSIMYYTSWEDAYFTFEQTEEGNFINVNGWQVYTSGNIDSQNYSWTQGASISVVYSSLNESLVLSMLSDFFAGNIMTREAQRTLIADVTPKQIDACIGRRLDDIRTDNFQEVYDLLGFVPPAFRPEVFGEVQPRFTVVFERTKIKFIVLYKAADSDNNVLFQANFYRSMAEFYKTFEQSEVGTFRNVSGVSVYCTKNLQKNVYCWATDQIAYFLSGILPEETTLPLLEAFFAGDVLMP